MGCSQHRWKRIKTSPVGEKDISIENNYKNKKIGMKTTPVGNKEDIKIEKNYYHCIRSYGSFAVIINNSIYETLLNMYKQKCKPVDNYLIDYQLNNKEKCIVMYPNKVIADVTTSNTGKARNQNKMAKKFRWI